MLYLSLFIVNVCYVIVIRKVILPHRFGIRTMYENEGAVRYTRFWLDHTENYNSFMNIVDVTIVGSLLSTGILVTYKKKILVKFINKCLLCHISSVQCICYFLCSC